MTLTGRTLLGIAILSIVIVGVVLMGNQRLAHADIVGDILCSINSDGAPVNVFSDEECTDQGGTIVTPPLPQCADGIDNDGDGLVDYVPPPLTGGDPGCSSFNDNDETDAPPPAPAVENTLALCSDGIDNDSDGHIDLADTDCASFKPKLTITKVVVNDNGGTKQVSDFALFVGSTSVSSGVQVEIAPGSYAVSETVDSGYVGAFFGDCNSIGSVTLAVGDTKACTLTNDDVATTTGGGDGGGGNSGGGNEGGNSGSGGGTTSTTATGGGGNGPIAGSFTSGVVLGLSTSSLPIVSCDMFLTSFIKPNGANDPEQVKRLQKILIGEEGASTTESGVYDEATLNAVRNFQEKYAADILAPWGITKPTGFVYLTTRRKVNDLYCRASGQTFSLSTEEQNIIERAKNKPAEESVTVVPVGSNTTVVAPAQPTGPEFPVQNENTSPAQTTEAKPSILQRTLRPISDFFSRLFKR